MKDVLKLALEALHYCEALNRSVQNQKMQAITALREALAESALERMAENARELGLDYEQPAPVAEPRKQEPVECQYGKGGFACCEGGPCKADEQNNTLQPAQQEPLDDHAEKEDVESLKRQLSLQTSMCIAYKKENEQLLAANKDCINHFDALKADYDALRAQQEPVAYGMLDTMLGKGNRMMMVRLDKGQDGCTVPLYTSPPAQRKPLTEKELMKCITQVKCFGTVKMTYESGPYEIDRLTLKAFEFARAIEAAHGIKENT